MHLPSLDLRSLASANATTSQSHADVYQQLRQQCSNPSDIFSLLLLVGGDVIVKALAQFHGRKIRPVAFSFGWVAFAFASLLSSVGNLKTMPDPDCPSLLINCDTGSRRENQSWLLGRLFRNRKAWSSWSEHRDVSRKFHIAIYELTLGEARDGWVFDGLWYSGLATTVFQLGVSAVPAGLYGQWEALVLTACGTVLAYLTGFLHDWYK